MKHPGGAAANPSNNLSLRLTEPVAAIGLQLPVQFFSRQNIRQCLRYIELPKTWHIHTHVTQKRQPHLRDVARGFVVADHQVLTIFQKTATLSGKNKSQAVEVMRAAIGELAAQGGHGVV